MYTVMVKNPTCSRVVKIRTPAKTHILKMSVYSASTQVNGITSAESNSYKSGTCYFSSRIHLPVAD